MILREVKSKNMPHSRWPTIIKLTIQIHGTNCQLWSGNESGLRTDGHRDLVAVGVDDLEGGELQDLWWDRGDLVLRDVQHLQPVVDLRIP